jgi:hypothetical protein
MPHHLYLFKNNSKNSRKNYYNSLRVINLNMQACMPHHLMSHHISLLKKSENLRKIIFTFFNGYDMRLLVMIFSVNKNYLPFTLIFDFSQLTEKTAITRGLSTSILFMHLTSCRTWLWKIARGSSGEEGEDRLLLKMILV